MQSVPILFLTAHVQPFLVAGISALIRQYPVRILLVHWPSPPDAPLSMTDGPGLTVMEKNACNRGQIGKVITAFRPQLVYGPGWMDKDYLRWTYTCRKGGATTLMGMDNQWTGSLKQQLLALLSPFILKQIYQYAFVLGQRQIAYALKLGFAQQRIRTGLYTPDTGLFSAYYIRTKTAKAQDYPRQFLYLGRLVAHKAKNLFLAFSSLSEAQRNGWTMLAVGNGPLSDDTCFPANILHIPYLPQEDMQMLIAQSGAACLTSEEEPWGTVIQELAAAGLPLIVSTQCGAGDDFLLPGANGFLCDGKDVSSIRQALRRMIALTDDERMRMSVQSHRLGGSTTPETWAATIMTLLPEI